LLDLKNKINAKPLNPDDAAILREHFDTQQSYGESFRRQIDLVAGFLTKTLINMEGAGGNSLETIS